jgi:hypothetical protein
MAMTAIEELENHVNDMINTMRKLEAAQDDPLMAANHPKLKELAHRLQTQMEHSRKVMAERGVTEREPGQAEPNPVSTQTPSEMLSSPYAGEEPRHAVMKPDGRPDPIAASKPTPPAEVAGATQPEDIGVMERDNKAAAKPADDKPTKK